MCSFADRMFAVRRVSYSAVLVSSVCFGMCAWMYKLDWGFFARYLPVYYSIWHFMLVVQQSRLFALLNLVGLLYFYGAIDNLYLIQFVPWTLQRPNASTAQFRLVSNTARPTASTVSLPRPSLHSTPSSLFLSLTCFALVLAFDEASTHPEPINKKMLKKHGCRAIPI